MKIDIKIDDELRYFLKGLIIFISTPIWLPFVLVGFTVLAIYKMFRDLGRDWDRKCKIDNKK